MSQRSKRKLNLKEKDIQKIKEIWEVDDIENDNLILECVNIPEINKPNNPKPNVEKKKEFEIIFPEEILEVLEKIIKSQNQDLLNIIGQDSIIDYSQFKNCQKQDKKVLLKS